MLSHGKQRPFCKDCVGSQNMSTQQTEASTYYDLLACDYLNYFILRSLLSYHTCHD